MESLGLSVSLILRVCFPSPSLFQLLYHSMWLLFHFFPASLVLFPANDDYY